MDTSQRRETEPLQETVSQVKVIKQTLYNIFYSLGLDYTALYAIAEMTQLPLQTVENVMLNIAVCEEDAQKVLSAFCTYTRKPGKYTLDTVKITLLPRTADIQEEGPK